MREGMDAIVAGTLNLDLLLTHTYALDELGRALDDVAERPDGFVKGVILL
jgi:threonine dehydrogenase-like Zn-dependent dehydrogenase